jgi:mRNA interferase HigB
LNPAELKAQFRSASILKGNRVVFNIKGNDYPLITSISYKQQAIFVKFIGTHDEYDNVDAETVDHSR